MNSKTDLTVYILDNEDGDRVIGPTDIFDKETFVNTAKSVVETWDTYENGFELVNVRKEPHVYTDKGIPSDCLVPVSLADGFAIENYWVAEIKAL